MGSGAGAGAGLLTKDSCFMLPLRLLVLDLGRGRESSALWSSSRRACAVATSSKNSSLCSEVTEEKMTAQRNGRVFFMLGGRNGTFIQSLEMSQCYYVKTRLRRFHHFSAQCGS